MTLSEMESDFSRPVPPVTPTATPTVHERQKALIEKIPNLSEAQRKFLIERYQPKPGPAISSDPIAQQKQLQVILRKITDPMRLSEMESDFSRPVPPVTPTATPTVHERQKALIEKIPNLSEAQRKFLIETYQPGVPISSDPIAQQKQFTGNRQKDHRSDDALADGNGFLQLVGVKQTTETMADDTINLPGSLSLDELLKDARRRGPLFRTRRSEDQSSYWRYYLRFQFYPGSASTRSSGFPTSLLRGRSCPAKSTIRDRLIRLAKLAFSQRARSESVPNTTSDRAAARGGNFTKELVTLCFPGSSKERHAVSNSGVPSQRPALPWLPLTARVPGGNDSSRRPGSGISDPGSAPGTAESILPGRPRFFPVQTRTLLAPKVAAFFPAHPGARRSFFMHTQDRGFRASARRRRGKEGSLELSRRIQRSHMFERGWADGGQHFTISRSSIIMEGRVENAGCGARSRGRPRRRRAGSNLHDQAVDGASKSKATFRPGSRETYRSAARCAHQALRLACYASSPRLDASRAICARTSPGRSLGTGDRLPRRAPRARKPIGLSSQLLSRAAECRDPA